MDTAYDLINGTDTPKSYPGQVYNADVQCKLLHGNDSTPCFVINYFYNFKFLFIYISYQKATNFRKKCKF
jgi:hypothetical protein